MKIIGGFQKIIGVDKTNNSKSKIEKTDKVEKIKDQLSISNIGKDYQIAMKALKEVPDIRQDKIEEIQEKISAGSYNVSAEQLAEKIVQSFFDQKI